MGNIRIWLERLGLGEYAESFEAGKIDADVLPHLTEQDLSELGVPIGPRRKILVAIRALAERAAGERSDLSAIAEPHSAAERRQITVMFCDVVGSTALSEALDAEDLREVMRAYMQTAGSVIRRYEGHVAQYLGDGIMSYFGWPAAHEDDAERAIRAALEIVDVVKSVAAPEPLRVRVGIASGQVVVGETGAGGAGLPKLAVGETPNLAARVQGTASPDEVVISESTRRLIGATFDLQDDGDHVLKGIAAPVHLWRVTGVAAADGRFEATHGGGLTPFVGRESELMLMVQCWERAKEGRGQVALLCGEAGIGKSRLAQMFRERLSGEAHTLLRYQGSPYHTHSALYPVIQQFANSLGFHRSDDSNTRIDKLEAVLRAAFTDVSAVAPLFAALLLLDTAGRYPPVTLGAQAQKEATLKAIADLVTAFSAQRPVLMIFEDVHWIDPTTQEMLDLTVGSVADKRLLVLITFRPEYRSPWSGVSRVTQLVLSRFDPGQAALMVRKVAGTRPLPTAVLDQIVARTDGVPLFLEELTKTVLESSLLERSDAAHRMNGPPPDLTIPSTLHDSLMARLDRLGPIREVAQIGACIGRQFSRELLAAVCGLTEPALDSALRQLVATELLFQVGQSPDVSYLFKHALVQDAAYASLLRTNRATIHKRIAETLLSDFAEVAQSAPETLAHHFTEGGVFDRAVGYWRMAAEHASARYANVEAIGHYSKGLATLARLPDGTERIELELGLRLGLTGSLRMADRYNDALAELDRAESLAERNNRLADLARIHHLRGNIYFPLGKMDRCLTEHQAAWEFARKAGSTEGEARALGGIGDAHYMAGRMLSAHEHFDRCITLCRRHRYDMIEVAYLPMRASTHMWRFGFDEALEDCGAVVDMVARTGQARAEIISRNISGWILLEQQDFAQAQQHAQRGLEVVEKIGARRFVPLFNDVLARIRLHSGDRAGALGLLEASLAVSRETGITFLGPFVLGAIALASEDDRRRQEALNEGASLLERGCVAHNYLWFYRHAIELSLEEGEWTRVDAYAKALEAYFAAEPLQWADFIVTRGRALAQFGRGAQVSVLPLLQELGDKAKRVGMLTALLRMEAAVKSARIN